jgi:hypothetical protein
MSKENIIEVPFTEVETVEENAEGLLNLEDVGYMVMVGRTKDGKTFFRTAGVNDLVLIRGLVEYARDEVKAETAKQRQSGE